MKLKRNLSGITGYGPENVCFEDLEESQQDEVMMLHSIFWHRKLIKQLANTITELGNAYSLMK